MKFNYIDLHMHSHYSDGIYSVSEMIDIAVQRGIKVISITDHDSIKANCEAVSYSVGKLDYIQGIEITTREQLLGEQLISLHLLGYGIKSENIDLVNRLNKRDKDVRSMYENLLDILRRYNVNIVYNNIPMECGNLMQLSDITSYLINNYSTHNKLRELLEIVEGYSKIINNQNIDIEEAINLIHNAGGIAIWVHPFDVYCSYKRVKINETKVKEIFEELNKSDIDGVEAYYLNYDQMSRKFLVQLAIEYKKLITKGSDFHGFEGRDKMFI